MIRSILCVAAVVAVKADDQTDMTKSLNGQIAEGKNGVFTGGKGIFVRTPDFFAGGSTWVVPATFWVNDIKAPSQAYPAGNPWCPHGQSDGFFNINWNNCDPQTGPWEFPTVSAVIGVDGMYKLLPEFDKIQDNNWGWGVFYATDANACDQRCRYLSSDKGWDCPGYWLGEDGSTTKDPKHVGAGFYKPGNPYAGKGGGGAGCHFDHEVGKMDQTDASGPHNLVQDSDCQCNYIFRDDWSRWVQTWMTASKQKQGFENRKWLGGGGGKAPAWAVDTAMCWVNNPRDMINLQNALWFDSSKWLNYKAPYSGNTSPHYWGWNEVPVDRGIADDPKTWDAVMIKLPASINSISSLGSQGQANLESQLISWETKGKIVPGSSHLTLRPGSYMVVVRENQNNGNWLFTREFFCENWDSPKKYYKLVFYGQASNNVSNATNGNGAGACFIDKPGLSIVV